MTYFAKIVLHMILMLVFMLFTVTGISIARYFKTKKTNWMKLHKTSLISGLAVALAGIAWIIFTLQVEIGTHFNVPHAYLGLASFLIAITASIIGFRFINPKTDKNAKPALRKFHKLIGHFSLLLVLITIVTGLIQFSAI